MDAVEAPPAGSQQAPHEGSYAFGDMNLQVGSRVQIELGTNRYFTSVAGFIPDEVLFVRTPVVNHVNLPVLEGEALIVRSFSGVHAFAFNARVERIFAAPLNYMHVSFPRRVQGAEIRRAIRVEANIPATLRIEGGPPSGSEGTLVNISATGALIEAAGGLAKSQQRLVAEFRLNVGPGDIDLPVAAASVVQNVRPQKTSAAGRSRSLYGVRFDNLPAGETIALQSMVWQALYQDRSRLV